MKAILKPHISPVFGSILGLYRDNDQFETRPKFYDICLNLQVTGDVEQCIKTSGLMSTIRMLEQSLNDQKIFGKIHIVLFFDGSNDPRKYLSFIGKTTNAKIKGFLGFDKNEWKVYE